MMKKLILFILLILYCILPAVQANVSNSRIESNQFHYSITALPEWVKTVEVPPVNMDNLPMGQAVHYILSDRQVLLMPETFYQHTTMLTANESGLEETSEIHLKFNPLYQELEIHNIDIIRDGQRINKLDANYIKLIQREEDIDQRLYDGVVTALIILDDIRVGDIVDYSYSVEGVNPVFGDKYFSSHTIGWGVPVEHVYLRLLDPIGRKLYMKSYNTDVKPKIRSMGAKKEYLWEISGAEAIQDEGEYPQWYDPYPWVQVTEYRNWDEVNQWAGSLYKYNGGLNEEILEKISSWKQQDQNKVDSIRNALKFVQENIRYFGVELGQNSHRPSHPNEVFGKRYGDCKDKALLLTAILQEFGVKSYPALVSTVYARGISDWLPSPGVFDHVIVMADLEGKHYWMDGTRTNQRGSLDSMGFPDYGKALVVNYEDKSLLDMIMPAESIPTVHVEEIFDVLDYNESVEMTVTSTYTGSEAEWQRQLFSRNSRPMIEKRYLNYYARQYPGADLGAPIAYNDNQDDNSVTVIEKYIIPEFWEKEDGRLYASFYGSTINKYTELPETVRRSSPLALQFPIKIEHTSILHYPDDIDFDTSINDDVYFVEDDAMAYVRKSSYKDRKLSVEYQYQTKADSVMPEVVGKHIRQLQKINDSLYYSSWVSSPEDRNMMHTETELSGFMKILLNSFAENK